MRQGLLVSSDIAAIIIAGFQIVIAWFILGNDDVLLQLTPITVGGIAVADALTWLGVSDARTNLQIARLVQVSALLCLIAFAFVAAIGTARGADPIGQPPRLTEWFIALGIVALSTFSTAKARQAV